MALHVRAALPIKHYATLGQQKETSRPWAAALQAAQEDLQRDEHIFCQQQRELRELRAQVGALGCWGSELRELKAQLRGFYGLRVHS